MSDPSNDDTIPSTPDPETVQLVAAFIRAMLTAASGIGIYHGAVDGAWLSLVAGSLVMAATLGWSIWQKFKAAQRAHASATVSAASGQPLKKVA